MSINTFWNPLKGTGVEMTTPAHIVARLITISLGLIGFILVGLIGYAGYMLLTSFGNPEKIKKAWNTIAYAALGLAIIMLSYAIVKFIFENAPVK